MYQVENKTESNLLLIDNGLKLAGKSHGQDSRGRLPDFARHHPDIEYHEDQDHIKIVDLDGDTDSRDDEEEIHDLDTPDVEEEAAEEAEVVEEEEAEVTEEKEVEEEAEVTEEKEVEEEAEEEEEKDLPTVDEFEELTKAQMKETLTRLGLDDDVDFRKKKDELVEFYKEWLSL